MYMLNFVRMFLFWSWKTNYSKSS